MTTIRMTSGYGRSDGACTGRASRAVSRASRTRAPASGSQEDFDGVAFVHRVVALGGPVDWQGKVEDLAGVDRAVPAELDQVGQEPAYRGRAAVHEIGEERVWAGDRDVVTDADEAHVPAGAGGADRLHGRVLVRVGSGRRFRPGWRLSDPASSTPA